MEIRKVCITKPKNKVIIALSKFDEKSSRDNVAALKKTTLNPKKRPVAKPINVIFEKKLLKNNLRSLLI